MKRYNLIVNRSIATFIICCCFYFLPFSSQAQDAIKGYSVFMGVATKAGKNLLVQRKFEKQGKPYYLLADPDRLTTQLILSSDMVVKKMRWEELRAFFRNTAYFKALAAAGRDAIALQDAGLTHGFPKERGITLTIDLCPSHKPLDRVIFSSLVAAFKQIEKPVPVALSVTGRWMLTHTDDLNWLKELVAQGEINITWIDHSYNHHFSIKAPLKTNFLLEPGTDLNFELLGTELAMLQHGLLPSVFFRFPGLVSDQQVVDKVLAYGIIPIGSDAWLAKGQPAHAGTIVLIHGNGNEPVGVADFIKLLKTKSAAIVGKEWLMYDLTETVEDEFSQ